MSKEINVDVYCASIIGVLQYLLKEGEESAKSVAKEFADGKDPILAEEFLMGAKSLAEKLSKTNHTSEEILPLIPLYIKFLRKFNSDFTPKSFLKKTFRGSIFSKSQINNLHESEKRVLAFLLRCLSGMADEDWFR